MLSGHQQKNHIMRISMKTGIVEIAAAIIIACASVPGEAADLEPLQGRWTIARTNQEGQVYSQVIGIEKDQLTFQIVGADSKVRFFSKGTVKATKVAPFDVLTITDMRAGRSEDDMQPVNDTRAMVYTLRDGNLFLASNFDRVRESEKPGAEIYVRKEQPNANEAEAKIVGKWKMDVTMGDTNYDYELRIARSGNRLEGVLVSPRSGELKCKTVRYDKGELVIEIDRDIQGNALTFVYQGKLEGDGLSGKFHVKEQEDQFSGTWKASKK